MLAAGNSTPSAWTNMYMVYKVIQKNMDYGEFHNYCKNNVMSSLILLDVFSLYNYYIYNKNMIQLCV